MTQYVCKACGATAITVSPDGITVPKQGVVIDGVTHCSNPHCENADPERAGDFVPASDGPSPDRAHE